MQIIDPLDPMMLIIYGLIITAIFLVYVSKVRRSPGQRIEHDNISSMAGGRIEEITTGAVQESMPAHLVSVAEEKAEEEGVDL